MSGVLLTSTDGDSRVNIQGDTASVSFKTDNNAWKVWRTGNITERRANGDIAITFILRKGSLTSEHLEVITPDFAHGTFTIDGGWTEE